MATQTMLAVLATGTAVTVEVPATSANLGPGFDCFGLALDWRERVELAVWTTASDRGHRRGSRRRSHATSPT